MKPLPCVDMFIIGGGINGAGIARDAAGRGLSVALCEKGDFAEGTSSRSGKLVHGGLRYLEYYEFRLVREALIEREVLLESAPHILWPMRFVLPHSPQHRPAWLIRLGLFLYDHLGGRKRLPATRVLKLRQCLEGQNLSEAITRGFEYSDCWVDDSRLVILNALDAHHHGAVLMSRTTFHSATREKNRWRIRLTDKKGEEKIIMAQALVNAAGPWVNKVIDHIDDVNSDRRVRLVKGSHIIVKKFWPGDHAYLLQNHDKRVIFVNPYEGRFALIGTTDVPQQGAVETAEVDQKEITYLLNAVNAYFKDQLTVNDVVRSYTGIRPLYDDKSGNPSAVTRDYVFDLNEVEGGAPFISVFGGKITTFRKLAEHLLDKLAPYFSNMGPAWTAGAALPGGDIADADFDHFFDMLQTQYPWCDSNTLKHLSRAYGTLCHEVLDGAGSMSDLGQQFSATFFECEARYLHRTEWALDPEDVLLRRTKHGLHMTAKQQQKFSLWWAKYIGDPAVSAAERKALNEVVIESDESVSDA